ncbi:hypothetical protein MJH12_07595 [bacterium]|nr:hypothetical protein [bacterium]
MKLNIILLAISLCFIQCVNAKSIVIVVNDNFPVGSISKGDLNSIFLGNKSNLSGKKVAVVEYKMSNPIRSQFSKKYLRKSISDIKSYWIKQMVNSGTRRPKSKKSFKSIKKYLQKRSTVIGYCWDTDVIPTGVKQLKIR